MIKPLEAKFLTSSPSLDKTPSPTLSEVAIVGRSNVGKSTLINALTGRKGLAKSSATPGKTRLINYFELLWDKEGERIPFRIVDLPGYGYAKVSKAEQEAWGDNLGRFLQGRDTLRLFLVLIDSRHPELPIDAESIAFLESFMRPDQRLLVVLTKSDKLGQKERSAAKKAYPDALMVSSLSGKGVEELRTLLLDELLGRSTVC